MFHRGGYAAAPTPLASSVRTRTRGRRLALCLLAVDAVALVCAIPVAIFLHDLILGPSGLGQLSDRLWILLLGLGAVPFLIAHRLYDPDRRRITVSSLGEGSAAFHALTVFGFFAVIVLVGTGGHTSVLTIGELALFWLVALVLIPLMRAAARPSILSRAVAPQRTLIIGAGRVGQEIARKLASKPDLNIEVVGFLDDQPQPIAPGLGDLKVLGGMEDVLRIVNESGAERIILSFSRATHEHMLEVLRRKGLDQLYISVVPRFFEIMASNVEVDDVAGIPVLDLQPARLSRPAMLTKRAFDLALVALAAPALALVFAIVAVAVRLDSPGPVFFSQPRLGRGGKVFRIFKFRTMLPGAELQRAELAHLNEVTGPLFKMRNDPRITRIGRVLRRMSLDELPQLWNVARGEMSLVGPRPFVVDEANQINGWARRRLDLTPGMTGAWQVMGRNDMPFEEMAKLDYLYVKNWSLVWDFRLLVQTPGAVLRRRGAY